MLKLLSSNNPLTYLLLFILCIALRAPSFNPDFVPAAEGFNLVAAEVLNDGGKQYVDVWNDEPPILLWVYAAFFWVFGSFTLIAIKISTALYLFICAILLNRAITEHRLLKNSGLLPAFFFILLFSVPWTAQSLTGETLLTLPLILAFTLQFNIGERKKANNQLLFNTGFLLALAFLIKYYVLILLLGLVVNHLFNMPFKVSELASLFSGFLLTVSLCLLILYLSGSLGAFLNQSPLYSLDYLFNGITPIKVKSGFALLYNFLKSWGLIVLFSIIGTAYYRINYFSQTTRIRKSESVFFAWLMSGLVILLLNFGSLEASHFLILAPALSIYCAKFFEFEINDYLKGASFVFLLTFPLFDYIQCLSVYSPKALSGVYEWVGNEELDEYKFTLNFPHILTHHLTQNEEKTALIFDPDPALHYRLGLKSATKYCNFEMVYNRWDIFPHNKGRTLMSGFEKSRDYYNEFEDHLPHYIIDASEYNFFPLLKETIPYFFTQYQEKTVGKYKLYYLPGEL